MKRFWGLVTAVTLALCATGAWAQKTVTFAYQDMMIPWRWVQQSGEVEKATGYKINYRQFGGGGDVIRAMASGDVQLGEVGSTGIATAISQGMDVEMFWVLEDIAAAEALVARNGILLVLLAAGTSVAREPAGVVAQATLVVAALAFVALYAVASQLLANQPRLAELVRTP